MKILICGSRDFYFEKPIKEIIDGLPADTVVIEGGASGADTIARTLAEQRGLKVLEYKADWKQHGRAAGPVRNQRMIDEGKPDLVCAFYNTKEASNGTHDMVEKAREAGIRVTEYDFFEATNRENIKLYARGNLAAPQIIDDVIRAKDGDVVAVEKVISKIADKEYLAQLKQALGDQNNTVYVPMNPFDTNRNFLPTSYARYLAENLGGVVLEEALFFENVQNKRKELNQWQRMVSHREFVIFDAEILKNKNVVLVDDQYTSGGTARDAYMRLREADIKVTGIICLGASRERHFLCDRNSIDELQDRFTSQELTKLYSLTGVDLYDLTQAEANLIIKTNKENVFPKLEQAYADIYENDESLTQPDNQKPPVIKEPSAEYRIKNKEIAHIIKGTGYAKSVPEKIAACEQLINRDANLSPAQKKAVTDILSDPAYNKMWVTEGLTPEITVAAGKLLSKAVAADNIYEKLNSDQIKIVKSTVRSFDKSLTR